MNARSPSMWRRHALPEPARAAREEIRRARVALEVPGDVHEARRALKRARALLRLCQAGPSADEARGIRHEIREAARLLSTVRDDEVAVEVAREMEREFGSPPSLVDALEERRRHSQATLDTGLGRQVRKELAAARRGTGGLEGSVDPVDTVARIGRAYARARAASRRARRRPSGTALHTLRKRVKDLRYQMEWLTPVWPAVLEGWTGELHALTDDLGRVQDIRVLRVSGHGLKDPGDRRRLAWALQGLRRERRRTLRIAFHRSQRLFAEAPGAFRARMAALVQLES